LVSSEKRRERTLSNSCLGSQLVQYLICVSVGRLNPLNRTNQSANPKLKSDERRSGLTKIPSRPTMVPGRSWRTIAILVAAAIATTHGFAPLNPSARSPSTYPAKKPLDPSASDQQPHQAQTATPAIRERNVAAVRALSAVATARAAEVEEDVSYGVAMVSCVVSLAIGFALGYGTLPS